MPEDKDQTSIHERVIDVFDTKPEERRLLSDPLVLLEPVMWVILASVPVFISLTVYYGDEHRFKTYPSYISNYPLVPLLFFLALAFPLFFKLIFDVYPFQSIRRTLRNLFRKSSSAPVNAQVRPSIDKSIARLLSNDLINAKNRVDYFDSNQLMSVYAIESQRVARRTFMLATAFLAAGLIVGGVGFGVFYEFNSQGSPDRTVFVNSLSHGDALVTATKTPLEPMDLLDRLVGRIPSIAILFFVEFGAFFLLRLFKSTMDEYRYYEEIARNREATLVAMKMAFERGDTTDTKSLVDTVHLYSTVGRFGKDETSDLIETRKLQEDEIVIFKKIIDAVGSRAETKEKVDRK